MKMGPLSTNKIDKKFTDLLEIAFACQKEAGDLDHPFDDFT